MALGVPRGNLPTWSAVEGTSSPCVSLLLTILHGGKAKRTDTF